MPIGYRTKFIIKQLARLEDEYVNASSIFAEASKEVENLFKQEHGIQEPEQPPQQEQQKKENTEVTVSKEHKQNTNTQEEQKQEAEEQMQFPEKEIDSEVKKLYRQIALKAHPDRLVSMPDGEEKEKLKIIFQNATKFMENNDYASLAVIAIKLDIDVEEFSENDLKKVKEKINIIKGKVQQIENTAIWQWAFAEDKKVKDKLLKALFKFMYDKRNKQNPRP